MFTGIVEAMGTIGGFEDRRDGRRLHIETAELGPQLAVGGSVAVDGACLTVTEADATGFGVDVIATTLERTLAGHYRRDAVVNLERALRMGDRLDGHLVQGHIDGLATLKQCVRQGDGWLMDVELPPDVAATTVERGSVTLNGVSLTVAGFSDARTCRIGLIPFTHAHTNLGLLRPGDPVNVEADLIGRYVGKLMAARNAGALSGHPLPPLADSDP